MDNPCDDFNSVSQLFLLSVHPKDQDRSFSTSETTCRSSPFSLSSKIISLNTVTSDVLSPQQEVNDQKELRSSKQGKLLQNIAWKDASGGRMVSGAMCLLDVLPGRGGNSMYWEVGGMESDAGRICCSTFDIPLMVLTLL